MDRQTLEIFYRGSANAAFRKALEGEQLDDERLSFLHEHVHELDIKQLVDVLRKPVADGVEPRVEVFVQALAEKLVALLGRYTENGAAIAVIASVPFQHVLDHASEIDADGWADLTRRLRGRLPDVIWYRFVDHVRGGQIFNFLNERPLLDDVAEGFLFDILGPDPNRPEPLVVPLLEERTNDLRAAEYVLSLPVNDILRVHNRLPDCLPLERVQRVVLCRVAAMNERWVPPLPEWMAPDVVERLRHCLDEEALDLYKWLSSQPPSSHTGNLRDIAVERFKLVVHAGNRALIEAWFSWIGSYLTTRKAWKEQGRAYIETLVNLDCEFPRDVVTNAIRAATSTDGASAEEHGRAILRTTHEVVAMVFVERAEKAMKGGDWATGQRFLSAFMSLDPGSFISGRVHHLGKIPHLPEKVRALIEACEELTQSGEKAPNEAALSEAFAVLRGGLS
jgi:hypothetical protein